MLDEGTFKIADLAPSFKVRDTGLNDDSRTNIEGNIVEVLRLIDTFIVADTYKNLHFESGAIPYEFKARARIKALGISNDLIFRFNSKSLIPPHSYPLYGFLDVMLAQIGAYFLSVPIATIMEFFGYGNFSIFEIEVKNNVAILDNIGKASSTPILHADYIKVSAIYYYKQYYM